MSYDNIVDGYFRKLRINQQLADAWIRFKTDETSYPTECGDGMHRDYRGKLCLIEPNRGEIFVDMGKAFHGMGWVSEVGFGEYEIVYGTLDTTDGHFKLKVPMGGLPLEPCARAVSQFLTDGGSVTKRGVRYTCDPNKLFANGPMLDGCGCVIWDYDLQAFVWAALNGHAFIDGGLHGSSFVGLSGGFGLNAINGKYSKYLWRLVSLPGSPPLRYIEQWTPSGLTLNYNYWESPQYDHTFGWYMIPGTDPPQPDYDKPIRYPAYIASPAFTTNDGEWTIRELVYYTGTFGSPWSSTYLYDNGRTGPKPYFQSSAQLIRYRAARVFNDPLGLGMELYDKYVLEPSDIHPDCDVFTILAQTADRALVYATDHATWTRRIYFVMNRLSGNIEHLHNWNHSDYSHLDAPQGGAFLSGHAVLWTYDNVNQKNAAFLAETGELRQYRHWRDYYKHNRTPIGSVDGQLGWTDSYYGSYAVIDHVHRGDLCFIAPKEDFYMIVAECQAEDIASGCTGDEEDFLRARGKFKIESLSSREPVVGATVTVDLWVGPRGGDPDYEDTLTGQTGSDGWVEFNSPCLERTDLRDFVFKFTVKDVVSAGLIWAKFENICDDAEQVFEGLPGWWCHEKPEPDPAQFQSGSPFKGQVGGKWYHIMVAETAIHSTDCVEYRFVCEDDPSLNSGWQNLANSTGTFPDGRSRVGRPHEYWAEVTDGGAPYSGYKWSVQYRACDCDDYEGGTPSPWRGIQN